MPAVRLVFLVALVAGVLAAIAASTTVSRDDQHDATSPVPGAAAPAGRTVRAAVPHAGPLVVRVGDTVDLRVTLPEAAKLVIDELGVQENVGPDVAMPVIFTPTTAGTYDLRVQTTGRSVLRIVVQPAEQGPGGATTTPAPTPRPGTTVSA